MCRPRSISNCPGLLKYSRSTLYLSHVCIIYHTQILIAIYSPCEMKSTLLRVLLAVWPRSVDYDSDLPREGVGYRVSMAIHVIISWYFPELARIIQFSRRDVWLPSRNYWLRCSQKYKTSHTRERRWILSLECCSWQCYVTL